MSFLFGSTRNSRLAIGRSPRRGSGEGPRNAAQADWSHADAALSGIAGRHSPPWPHAGGRVAGGHRQLPEGSDSAGARAQRVGAAPRRGYRSGPSRRASLTNHSGFSKPSFSRLSAVAVIASSFVRGAHPSTSRAFRFVAFLRFPSSGTICLIAGSQIEARRINQFGS